MPTLLITGVTGFLGRAVARRAGREGWTVAGTFRTSAPGPQPTGMAAHRLDVRDAAAVRALVAAVAPDAVIHTAYLQRGDQAAAVNVDGSAHVAAAARAAGARLVHLSSDAIFRDAPGRALREDDPPHPVTAYGATKAAAEVRVRAADPGALLVRTSLLYAGPGQAPGPHERTALAVARGEQDMTFFDDEIRCPVQVDDLAAALLELARADDLAGPLHVAGADAVDRATFARLIVAAAGLDPALIRAGPRTPDRAGDCTLDCRVAEARLGTRLRGVREVLRAGAG